MIHQPVMDAQQMLGFAELQAEIPGPLERLPNLLAGGTPVIDQRPAKRHVQGKLATAGRLSCRERIELPEIYFAHDREVVDRDGMLYAVNEHLPRRAGEESFVGRVRYRTVGDASCTAAVRSDADTIEKVIAEVAATRITERGATRGDDKFSEAAMEDRKREGYF